MGKHRIDFTVYADLSKVGDRLEQIVAKAEHELAQTIRKDTSPFVPAKTETLDKTTIVEGNKVIYTQPYANYLYRGKLGVDPDTGSAYAPKGASKILTDRNLVFNTSVHPQAQSHWFEASKAQNLDKWVKAAQKAIDKGIKE